MPIFHKDVKQYSATWDQLRCGLPTASQFHRIITPKGLPSKSAEMYMFELIGEKITGEPTASGGSYWTDRGSGLEQDAVTYFEFLQEVETEPVGFITDDLCRYGASPDRLVGDNALLEIKIGKPATHIGLLLKSGAAYEEHRIQTQGQLLVAEREFNWLLAYNPGLPPALYRAEREEGFLKLLKTALERFSEVLEANYQLLVERGIGRPTGKAPPSLTDLLKQSLIELNRTA